jgi:hypothetical protein
MQALRLTCLPAIVLMLLSINLFSCTGKTKKSTSSAPQTEGLVNKYKKPGSSFSDTLRISEVCVVFFSADSAQLQKIRAITSASDFDSHQHDCFFQMKNARNVLQTYWKQLSIIESNRHRYLLFTASDGAHTIIDLDTIGDNCGIFLFNRKKTPQLADMTNFDTALEFYFNH